MSTILRLYVNDFDSRIGASLGLVGDTPVERLEHADGQVSSKEKQDALREVDSVLVGSTRYTFPRELPNALEERPTVVDERTIDRVVSLAKEEEIDAKDNVYADPNPAGVVAFLKQHRGDEVFAKSVSMETMPD